MSLDHAILGLLNYEPMTGYDIKKMVDISIAHFWPAVQSQIYKNLSKMEKEGWLAVDVITQDSKPSRKVYHLTEAGKTELFRWLNEPQPAAEVRLAWLIQIFFAGRLADDQVIKLLEFQLNLLQKRLSGYSTIPEENREEMSEDDPREKFFWMLTVDYGIAQSIAQVKWIQSVIETIQRGEYRLPTI
jgi:DNA-binding PadR family transcriptional regulator